MLIRGKTRRAKQKYNGKWGKSSRIIVLEALKGMGIDETTKLVSIYEGYYIIRYKQNHFQETAAPEIDFYRT